MYPVEARSPKLVVRSHFSRGTSITEHQAVQGPLKRILDGAPPSDLAWHASDDQMDAVTVPRL